MADLFRRVRRLELRLAAFPRESAPEQHDHSGAPTPQVSHGDLLDVTEDQHHARSHALDSPDDHTGEISDAQHGVRATAGAHAHGDLSAIGEDDHHASLVHPFRRTAVGVSTTVSEENRIIGCTAHSITITVASAAVGEGNWFVVNDESGGAGGVGQAITVDTEGGETIDGMASVTIDENHGSFWLYSDGTNWFSMATAGVVL